ncbi:MAG TPA: DUF4159 domain-containing protein [Rhizomicrobium sp.]|jgi:hypothetical protein
MISFAGLSFAAPLILLGLLALPAIWWLLRVTPPSPRRVAFPPLRLLRGLIAAEETPARTPPWLLALRMLAAAILIIALAEPTIGEAPKPIGSGPLVLFVDNGWTAAHAWADRDTAISDALNAAARARRPVAIVPTASASPQNVSLLDSGAALRAARDLTPEPWLPDRARALFALSKAHFAATPQILWLSDGLDYGGDAAATARALSKIGHVAVYADPAGKTPLAVKPESNQANGFGVTIVRADPRGPRSGDVLAIGANGESLASAPFRFAGGQQTTTTRLALPLEVRNETQRIEIANEDSAGAVRLLDLGAKRRAVGLVSASNIEDEQPLLSDVYYLSRALSPYAELHKGTIADALKQNVSVLVLADIGRIAGADHDRVAKFVSDGGVLVRFAGGRMTEGVDDLIPVKLRTGGRYLGGALAWASPQHLAPFPDASPFRGLSVRQEVTVSRQVLAEPSVELASHTWARLADGTPLVTAAQRGKGWIVLFHVTASPAWSSLPLSGLYVDMLRRVLDLGGGARPSAVGASGAAAFPPARTLDGFGRLQKPPAEALAVRGSQLAHTKPSPQHPPGFYGAEGSELALNTVGADTTLTPFGDLGVAVRAYSGARSVPLQAPLLAIAMLILLADVIISLWLRGYLANARRWVAFGAGALLLASMLVPIDRARADDAFDMKAALDTRLAYVITGLPDVDEMSKAGLTGLGLYLKVRTSYDPKEPVGVDLDKDDLAFFPLLYWPMDPREHDLSPKAVSKIGDYMRNGGTILFDTRDPSPGPNAPGEQTLRRLVGKLDLPPLQPVPSDHVLTKSFYLLQDFPGRWDNGKVWVERLPPPDPDAGPEPARGGDGVSPVIIGSNDWASAWAVDSSGQPIAEVSGGDQQREMAVRFGINVVMYALTGNYKTDQVHAPAILQRMGHP